MIYSEWIRLFGMAVQLFNLTDMNRETIIDLRWDKPDSLVFNTNNDSPSLHIDVRLADNDLLTTIVLIPWQDLYEPAVSPENKTPLNVTWNLLTVTEFVLVYSIFEKTDLNEDKKTLLEKYKFFFSKLFDLDENNKIINQADGVSSPEGLQLISLKEHKYYDIQEIALPGSKSVPLRHEMQNTGKMVLRHLKPDYGPVKSQWIALMQALNDSCILALEKQIISLFDSALQVCINNPYGNRRVVYDQTINEYKRMIDLYPEKTEFSVQYGNKLLQKLLYLSEPGLRELFEDNPFSGYVPKNTPDIASDYMPTVTEYFMQLPAAELTNLCNLLSEFKKYRKLARKNRGKWVEGNMILGARPKEYEPSPEELVFGETGERIIQIMNNNPKEKVILHMKEKRCHLKKIKFRKFTFTHFDVMGSGRFFYVNTIEEIKMKL